jgi:gas vesicle protein
MSTSKVVLGTLAGLAIGAIAGILLAPEKGSTTRKQILDKGKGLADGLSSKFDEFGDAIKQNFEASKKEAEDLVSKGKEKYDDVKKDFRNAANNFSNDAAQHKQGV